MLVWVGRQALAGSPNRSWYKVAVAGLRAAEGRIRSRPAISTSVPAAWRQRTRRAGAGRRRMSGRKASTPGRASACSSPCQPAR